MLILTLVLGLAVLMVEFGGSVSVPDAARWPTNDAVYAVDGWTVGPASLEVAPAQFRVVSRTYTRSSGESAELALWTSPNSKRIYRAGPEVPYLNAGFDVEGAPPGVLPAGSQFQALVLRKGAVQWLELHAYGERRGLLGTGGLAWSMAALDGILGRSNDYYLVRLTMPMAGENSGRAAHLVSLMKLLTPRLTEWYSHA